MGNIITNWAKEQRTGGGVAKAILLCLADNAKDYDRGRVSMTIPQIAAVIEFSERAVIDNLKKLEDKNNRLISRDKSKNANGTNNPNLYQILCPPEIFIKENEPEKEDVPAHSAGDALSNDHQGAGDAPGEAEKTPEICVEDAQRAGDAPHIVREMHLEHSAGDAPSTVLKEEEFKNNNFSFSARAREPEKFKQDFLSGLKKRMKLERLPAQETYIEAAQWLFANKFTAERALLCYDTLRRQIEHPKHWRKPGRISARNITENIAHLDDLIKQLDDWDKEEEKEIKPKNEQLQTSHRSHKPPDERFRRVNATDRRIAELLAEGLAEEEQDLQGESNGAACQNSPPGKRRAA